VEFPFYPPDRTFHNAPYLLNATRHWRPMLNGYSGLVPASYATHYAELRRFPDPPAMTALRAWGVTHVVVHDTEFRAWNSPEAADAVPRSPDLELIEMNGAVSLYRIR
jgi:hypothetical protein